MALNLSNFQDFFSAGLSPVPLLWNADKKEATGFPKHGEKPYTIEEIQAWLHVNMNTNAVALKMMPPFGSVDFDTKNTQNKEVFSQWFEIIRNTRPEILEKVCIESTKTAGFHVYIKYAKLDHKIPIARNPEGYEVISIYTGGLLSFCDPTPGYKLFHNDFNDLDFLTDDEFEFLVSTAALFNEYEPQSTGEKIVIDYPVEYESICLQFDAACTDEIFEGLLKSIGLVPVKGHRFRNKKWVPYLREGSTASYSAKAYFKSKRLLIFSASMSQFPTWHDSAKSGDNTWSLSPSKILYYKNNRSWTETIDEIKAICDSAAIDIVQPDITKQPIINQDRLKFPYDIFPEAIQNYIQAQVIQHEYLAAATLVALSSAIGNSAVLQAMPGYYVKPILYLSIVAPPGASKSPALKKAFAPLEEYDSQLYKGYSGLMQEYRQELARYHSDKKNNKEPEKPEFKQVLIKDSTIEMVIKIMSQNRGGCCLFADELSGFLARMNQYKDGDEVQKWLEMWSGASVLLQRITRDENKVEAPFCSIVGGIQPGVLESLSKAENEHNGFFHRFLFCYPEPMEKAPWMQIAIPQAVKIAFTDVFSTLLALRDSETVYRLSDEADALYKRWFDHKNTKYNRAQNDQFKGIIAKYQDYCLRFAVLIQAVTDGSNRGSVVDHNSMERAIRLTEYFLGNMSKAIKILAPETPVDRLRPVWQKFYAALPVAFETATAIKVGAGMKLNDGTVKSFLSRNKDLFISLGPKKYEKVY